jgi:hypothetical protein
MTESKEDRFKRILYENGECKIGLEIKFIGYYKVKVLMLVINILNLVVIPKRLVNKKTIIIDCNFKIK